MTTQELMTMVETMPIEIKTQLVDKILNSMTATQKETEALWVQEAENRVAGVKDGSVKVISGEKVFQDIQDRYS